MCRSIRSRVCTFPITSTTGWASADAAVVFFFQAEDGIRDSSVTGVQTCPLPISYAGFCLRSKDHTSELQSHSHLVCRLLLESGTRHVTIQTRLVARLPRPAVGEDRTVAP